MWSILTLHSIFTVGKKSHNISIKKKSHTSVKRQEFRITYINTQQNISLLCFCCCCFVWFKPFRLWPWNRHNFLLNACSIKQDLQTHFNREDNHILNIQNILIPQTVPLEGTRFRLWQIVARGAPFFWCWVWMNLRHSSLVRHIVQILMLYSMILIVKCHSFNF